MTDGGDQRGIFERQLGRQAANYAPLSPLSFLARAAAVHLMPQAELFVIYLIMAAVLMIRPEGLFKRETARRI